MKKILILIICLVVFCRGVYAQTTTIPDAAFEQRLIQLGIDSDGLVNGQILNSDAASVTNLDVGNSSIHNLTGIEAFVNLTTLRCYNNNIDTLDVSGNLALEILQCSGNNILDISISSVLKELDCSYNNLTNLDFSNAVSLVTLICNSNDHLKSLDLQGAVSLTGIECIHNDSLTNLDLSGATALDWIRCHTNSLTNLNIAGLTALTELDCNNNNLTELNLSGLTSLGWLTCANNEFDSLDLSGVTMLKYLDCGYNDMVHLNISNISALEKLYCYYNNLMNLDVSTHPNLIHLLCYDNNLTELDLMANLSLVLLGCQRNFPYLKICVSNVQQALSNSNWTKDASAVYTQGCYPYAIAGRVAIDANNNCVADSLEQGLIGQLVKFEKTSDATVFYAATYDSLGHYNTYLDTGAYIISVIPSSPYWQSCPSSQSITIDTNYTPQIINWSLQSFVSCSLLEVDISAPFLRMTGGGSAYTVSYCNNGTVAASNASVEVDLDPSLNFISSSIPVASQTGTVYTFNLGAVGVGACGDFEIQVVVDTSAQFEQTHCTEVHIYPDSICLPIWSGSIVDGDVSCQNDSVLFFIENIGSAMLQQQPFTVIQDDIAMRTGTIQLGAGQSTVISEYAAKGSTYRIEVEQAAGFPALLGDPIFSKAIEGCNPYADGSFNTGFITQFSNGYSSPFQAIDCQQNIASYDPNDKSAQPKGYGTAHYIEQNIPIDYKVRFQNTGTDTAFNIVIVDTLSPYVEVSSLQMGTSSHNYTWAIEGGNVLKVTFPDILLVDSNANEPLSHGFFRYRINQVLNNPLGSVIENQAAIYFDYNPPIFTNTTFHTVGENFVPLVLSVGHIYVENIKVIAYPNPFQVSTTIKVEGDSYDELTLSVFDVSGRLMTQKQCLSSNQIELSKDNLSSGIYIYQLIGDGQLLNTGKIIAQ